MQETQVKLTQRIESMLGAQMLQLASLSLALEAAQARIKELETKYEADKAAPKVPRAA
jgi:hypothetical protein